jgi:hypothetical protein
MNVFYSDSKTDPKLRWDYCIKFKGTQDVYTRLMAVCCMLLPHNPYRLPQHYKGHIYGLSYSCKHRYLWITLVCVHARVCVCERACMYVCMCLFLLHAPLLEVILHALLQIQCITISTLIITYYRVNLIYLV